MGRVFDAGLGTARFWEGVVDGAGAVCSVGGFEEGLGRFKEVWCGLLLAVQIVCLLYIAPMKHLLHDSSRYCTHLYLFYTKSKRQYLLISTLKTQCLVLRVKVHLLLTSGLVAPCQQV